MARRPVPVDRRAGSARWPALAATVLLLGACATGAPPRPVAIDLPPAYDAMADAVASADVTALDRWWTLYDDPVLTGWVERALAGAFSVREARARLVEARALRTAALARFGPQGNVQGSAEVRETRDLGGSGAAASLLAPGGAARSATLSLPVSWELDVYGRSDVTARTAAADVDAARFELAGARAAVAAETARTLFQARGLAAQRDESRQTLRIQRELLRVVGERVRRGIAAGSETDRVAADLALAEAQAEDLDAALAATRRALRLVVGDATAAVGVDDVQASLGAAPPVPPAVPGELLARRPDVGVAAARVRRAAGSVRLAELDFLPRFTLNPGVGLTAQRGAVDATTGFWSIAAGLTVPVLDRARLHAQLAAEGARAEQAVLALERTVQTAYAEADQSLTRLRADRRRVATLGAGETRARSAYDAALKRYELGFADLQQLLDAERAWRATRSALTAARLDALQRSVQAFQALGGGWDASAAAAPVAAAAAAPAAARATP